MLYLLIYLVSKVTVGHLLPYSFSAVIFFIDYFVMEKKQMYACTQNVLVLCHNIMSWCWPKTKYCFILSAFVNIETEIDLQTQSGTTMEVRDDTGMNILIDIPKPLLPLLLWLHLFISLVEYLFLWFVLLGCHPTNSNTNKSINYHCLT